MFLMVHMMHVVIVSPYEITLLHNVAHLSIMYLNVISNNENIVLKFDEKSGLLY